MIVVGSGPAGVAAAEAFREHKVELPVTIVTADPALPYARPPLSKEYLRGDSDDIALHPARWYDERSITLVHGATVNGIDLGARSVAVDGTPVRYRWLVLACGAQPSPLPVPGGERALQLRSAADPASPRRLPRRLGGGHRRRVHRL